MVKKINAPTVYRSLFAPDIFLAPAIKRGLGNVIRVGFGLGSLFLEVVALVVGSNDAYKMPSVGVAIRKAIISPLKVFSPCGSKVRRFDGGIFCVGAPKDSGIRF